MESPRLLRPQLLAMRRSASIVSRANCAVSCTRAIDSLITNAWRLWLYTCTAPIIRNEPMDSATISSTRVTPSIRSRAGPLYLLWKLSGFIPSVHFKDREGDDVGRIHLISCFFPGNGNLVRRWNPRIVVFHCHFPV